MIYLYWVAVFAVIALALAVQFGRRLEQTFAPALFIGILVMYLFGLAGSLLWSLGAVSLLGGAAGVWLVVQAVRRKQLFVHRWLTPGAVVLVGMVFFIAWMQSGRLAIGNDEFSHWAYTVKVMVNHDQLGVWHSEEMLFGEYPPALALLEYLFVRLTPGFTEGYLYRAMMLFQVSLLFPVLSRFGWKRLGGALAGFAGVFLLPLAFYGQFYSDLCVDGTLALLFAYLLYAWLSTRRLQGFVTLQLSLGTAVLVLTKESGVIFALAALAFVAWDGLRLARAGGQPGAVRQCAVQLAFPAAALVLARLSWGIVVAMQGLTAGGSGNTLERLLALAGPWPEKWSLTLSAFLEHLFLPVKNESVLPLSPVAWLVLGITAVWALRRVLPRLEPSLRRLSLGLAAGFAVYSIGLLYLYFFQFSDYEATRVASLERYLGSWLLAVVLLAAYLALGAWGRVEGKRLLGPGCVLAAALLVMPGTSAEIQRLVAPAKGAALEQQQRAAYFTPESFPMEWGENDKLYFVAEDTASYEVLCAHYSFYPQAIDSSAGYNFNTEGDWAAWANEVSAEQWAETLTDEGYTYVYLYQISPSFAGKYSELFADPTDIVGGALYAVQTAEDGVQLARVWPALAEG
ncbi:hypothetical protein [Fournierella sp.]|uniref:hypothetical protein n=1 Tax=Allofournierella sp. TaxID=1940256 RepID=UPI0025BB0CE3|nr:hypothetical protein [Fournierella sp.]